MLTFIIQSNCYKSKKYALNISIFHKIFNEYYFLINETAVLLNNSFKPHFGGLVE